MDNTTVRIAAGLRLERQLCILTCVYVARQSQLMVITVCLVASVPDVTHATQRRRFLFNIGGDHFPSHPQLASFSPPLPPPYPSPLTPSLSLPSPFPFAGVRGYYPRKFF